MIKKKSILFTYIRLKIVTKISVETQTCLSFITPKWLYILFYYYLPKIFKCKFSHIIPFLQRTLNIFLSRQHVITESRSN